MIKCTVEYVNYDSYIHKDFPTLRNCKVFSKNGIINVYLESHRIINEIVDDIGYDSKGKFICISVGQWHNSETGEYISQEEFFDLSEYESYKYDHVSANLKIYVKDDYRACYLNEYDRKVCISLIPYSSLNFTQREADEIYQIGV